MEDKQEQFEHIEQQKEFADQFLAELVVDLEALLAKYSAKLPFGPCYSVIIEALNEIKQVITLFKIWKERLNER